MVAFAPLSVCFALTVLSAAPTERCCWGAARRMENVCLTINFSTQLERTTSWSPRPMFYSSEQCPHHQSLLRDSNNNIIDSSPLSLALSSCLGQTSCLERLECQQTCFIIAPKTEPKKVVKTWLQQRDLDSSNRTWDAQREKVRVHILVHFFPSGMADHALRLGPYMRRSSLK